MIELGIQGLECSIFRIRDSFGIEFIITVLGSGL